MDLVDSDQLDSQSDVVESESSSESLPRSEVEDLQLSAHVDGDQMEAMQPDPTGPPPGESRDGSHGTGLGQHAVVAAAPAREVVTCPIDRLGIVPGLTSLSISSRLGHASCF